MVNDVRITPVDGNNEDDDAKAIKDAGVPTEEEMREAKVPSPHTEQELLAYIKSLVDRPHDYGTCVYAMSMASVATFQYVAGKLGVTGFQASCADLNFLRRTRKIKTGFRIINYDNLMYPQYLTEEDFPSLPTLLWDTKDQLAEQARKELEHTGTNSHPGVIAWWKVLASLPQLTQEEIRGLIEQAQHE